VARGRVSDTTLPRLSESFASTSLPPPEQHRIILTWPIPQDEIHHFYSHPQLQDHLSPSRPHDPTQIRDRPSSLRQRRGRWETTNAVANRTGRSERSPLGMRFVVFSVVHVFRCFVNFTSPRTPNLTCTYAYACLYFARTFPHL
jgi:hypothetical protein